MARKKVKLAWIEHASTRRSTYRKRKEGLIKKVKELSILCGVRACAVVYGPQDRQQPEVWPSPEDALSLIRDYCNMPDLERCKKVLDQEGFLKIQVSKLQEKVFKMNRANTDLEVKVAIAEGVAGKELTYSDDTFLAALSWNVELKLKTLYEKMAKMKLENSELQTDPTKIASSSNANGQDEKEKLSFVPLDFKGKGFQHNFI